MVLFTVLVRFVTVMAVLDLFPVEVVLLVGAGPIFRHWKAWMAWIFRNLEFLNFWRKIFQGEIFCASDCFVKISGNRKHLFTNQGDGVYKAMWSKSIRKL